jgi:hypothetical protein
LPEKATDDYQRNGTTTLFAAFGGSHRHGHRPVLPTSRQGLIPRLPQEGRPRLRSASSTWCATTSATTSTLISPAGWRKSQGSHCISPQPQEILAQPGGGVLQHHHRQAIRRGSFDGSRNSPPPSRPSSLDGTTTATPSTRPKPPLKPSTPYRNISHGFRCRTQVGARRTERSEAPPLRSHVTYDQMKSTGEPS